LREFWLAKTQQPFFHDFMRVFHDFIRGGTASHPSDVDPGFHPSDEDLSPATPGLASPED
jgi:hypothetical protein